MAKKSSPKDQGITAYKALNADFTCRDHQFEVGQTYTVEGKPVICEHGFHACENPLDVLNYYDLCNSKFARVTITGAVDRQNGDSKLCGASITVEAELSLPEWIGASIKWLIEACKGGKDEKIQAASGDYSQLAASGDYSQLAASGYSSQLAASGYSSQLAASGDHSQLAASGYSSQLAASGYSSKLAASGDYSQLAASGDHSQLAASGYSSKLEVIGGNSAAAAVGPGSHAKVVAGTPVAICEYGKDGKPIGFATGIAGTDFPADTWVMAKGGKLVAVAGEA